MTYADGASLLDAVGLRLEPTELLGVEVDVIGADTLRGEFGDRVRREAIPLCAIRKPCATIQVHQHQYTEHQF